MPCVFHPSRATAVTINGRDYCARCQTDQATAAAQLDAHVVPRACFVWYTGTARGWQPIDGTGCAHYVSHQLGIRSGPVSECCLEGYTYRVPVMLLNRTRVTGGLTAVQLNDIWVNPARSHTGIVTRIVAPAAAPPGAPAQPGTPARPGAPAQQGAAAANPTIWITHASSGQHAVATDRFDQYFSGRGDFYR